MTCKAKKFIYYNKSSISSYEIKENKTVGKKKPLIWLHKVKWLNKFNQISYKQLNIVK